MKNLLPEKVHIHIATYKGGVNFGGYYELQGKTLKCTINYPLSKPCIFDITIPKRGFPINDIIESVINKYKEIYKEEDETLTELSESPFLLNRGVSNGKYGIWGHVISDLYLERIYLNEDEITLSVGS